MAKKKTTKSEQQVLKDLLKKFPEDSISHHLLKDGVKSLEDAGDLKTGDEESDKLIEDIAKDLKNSKNQDDLKQIAKRLENAHTKLETIQRNMRAAKAVQRGVVATQQKQSETMNEIRSEVSGLRRDVIDSHDKTNQVLDKVEMLGQKIDAQDTSNQQSQSTANNQAATQAQQGAQQAHNQTLQTVNKLQKLVVVQMQQYTRHQTQQRNTTLQGMRRILSKGFNFDAGNLLIGMSNGDPLVTFAVNKLRGVMRGRRNRDGGRDASSRSGVESRSSYTMAALEQQQTIPDQPVQAPPAATQTGGVVPGQPTMQEELAAISEKLTVISEDVKTLVRISSDQLEAAEIARAEALENAFESKLQDASGFNVGGSIIDGKSSAKGTGSLRRIVETAIGVAGGGAVAAAAGALGAFATNPVTLVAGGILWAAIDGVMGYFKAGKWGTSSVAAMIGGFFGGSLNNKILNTISNMGKWAVIGAGLGSVFPVVGTLLGGLLGAGIGGILGYFAGGKKIAKFVDEAGEFIGSSVKKLIVFMKDVVMSIFDAVVSGLKGIKDIAAGWIESVKREVKSLLPDWVTGKENLGGATGSWGTPQQPMSPKKRAQINRMNKIREATKPRGNRTGNLTPELRRSKVTEMFNYESFIKTISMKESGGDYTIVNDRGYLGKYQFGAMALEDVGLLKPGASKGGQSALDNPNNWTILGGKEAFLASPQLQENAMHSLVSKNYNTLQRIGVLNESSSAEDVAGALAASHLVGPGGAKKLILGGVNTADGNGTKASTYLEAGAKSQLAGNYQPNFGSMIDKTSRELFGNQTNVVINNIQPVSNTTNNNGGSRGGVGKTGNPGTSTLQSSIRARS